MIYLICSSVTPVLPEPRLSAYFLIAASTALETSSDEAPASMPFRPSAMATSISSQLSQSAFSSFLMISSDFCSSSACFISCSWRLFSALFTTFANTAIITPARIAMTAMTMTSSTSVKPLFFCFMGFPPMYIYFVFFHGGAPFLDNKKRGTP